MGGNGASSSRIQRVKSLQNNLTSAKAKATRLEKKYLLAAGAVRVFDWNSGKLSDKKKQYEEKVDIRDKARKAWQEAVDKRDKIQSKIDKMIEKNKPKGDDLPLF